MIITNNLQMNKFKIFIILFFIIQHVSAQTPLLTNIENRKGLNLNGQWHYIVDTYETGFYDYRSKERKESDPEAFWNSAEQKNKTERKEHGYSDKYVLNVPGDWNHQKPEFFYYEGTIWYQKSFDYNINNKNK